MISLWAKYWQKKEQSEAEYLKAKRNRELIEALSKELREELRNTEARLKGALDERFD